MGIQSLKANDKNLIYTGMFWQNENSFSCITGFLKNSNELIKLNFLKNNYGEMMTRYKQLLTYIKSAVTRNHSEKSINSILDYISTSKQVIIINFLNKVSNLTSNL